MILETACVNPRTPKTVSSQLLFLFAASLCFLPNSDIDSWVPKVLCRKISQEPPDPHFLDSCVVGKSAQKR